SAVLAFKPRQSDLPLQVAFPILFANLTGELMGTSTAPTEAIAPGTPVQLHIPSRAIGLSVVAPDGTETRFAPSSTDAGGTAVTFAATDRLGIYTVTPIRDPDATTAPSASAATPRASPSRSAGASRSASGAPEVVTVDDPMAPVRFVVALFDVDESTIAPGSPATIEALGSAGVAGSPAPGASGAPAPNPSAVERPTTHDELWVPIVLLVLVGLCVEWALFHRDGLVRARRALADRLRPPSKAKA
ncbi:MAG: hypothetical protein ACJ77D_05975, partial [Chloroflexota bacterium]